MLDNPLRGGGRYRQLQDSARRRDRHQGERLFLATRVVGSGTTQTLIRHVLPNIMAPLIIIFSINVGGVIISEASLSFLGFGLRAASTRTVPGRFKFKGRREQVR